jgi:hypothetical protein
MANTDDDNLSELLDDDKLEGAQFPPDQPLGVNDRGIGDGQDSLEERMRREVPDNQGSGVRREDIGTLIDPTPGVDDEPDAVATAADEDPDQLGLDTTTQDLEEVEPAEEAAMHITKSPPMGDGDGYVEG